jgi:glycosyltransferase involved in cell wall biosynthesis
MNRPQARVALIHDWMTGMRGGEYVFEAIAELFPKSELFTLLYVPASVSPTITAMKRHTSPLQKMPGAERRYRHFLPMMPRWIEKFDLSSFDLVVSSSHCVAKGVRKSPDAVHVSYVHAPMRYMWDRYDDYFGPGRASPPVRLAAGLLRKRFQEWDRRVSQSDRVDTLIGNSKFIADQIEAAYGRQAQVIYPFADGSRFKRARQPGKTYLMVGAFAPNKRVDLAIEAFNRMKLPLLIVGNGQEKQRLQKIAGPTIDFLGSLSNDAIADLYAKCKAFIFPGKEDFGITPIEAMAAGAPVIAFGEGGANESIVTNIGAETGILFRPQTVEALMEAVMKLESGEVKIDEAKCRERAGFFSKGHFQKEISRAVHQTWIARGKDPGLLSEEVLSRVNTD